MVHSPKPRRIPTAYRHALILAAVICATVIGIFLADPQVRSEGTNAAAPVALYAGEAAPSATLATTPARGVIDDAQVWAADDTAKGARPDASH